jgi:hypothetical protein
MSDDDKALVERLRWGVWHFDNPYDGEVYSSDDPLIAADRIEEQAAEIERLKAIVRGWHYLAVGPDEMGDYYTQKTLIKASEPYADPALAKKAEQ